MEIIFNNGFIICYSNEYLPPHGCECVKMGHVTQSNSVAHWCVLIDFGQICLNICGTEEKYLSDFCTLNDCMDKHLRQGPENPKYKLNWKDV